MIKSEKKTAPLKGEKKNIITIAKKANFIVGIGNSKKGGDAIILFFDNVLNENACYIILQDVSQNYQSMLLDLRTRHAAIKIEIAENNSLILPSHIYIVPGTKDAHIKDGRLCLTNRAKSDDGQNRIDFFLNSLAKDIGKKAIAVILSGDGKGGSRGIEAVKKAGGLVLAQDPVTAYSEQMPQSAIESGMVDLVLPVESMASEINNFISNPNLVTYYNENISEHEEEVLLEILNYVRNHTSRDFTNYKRPTIIRRLKRRMLFHHKMDMAAYCKYLFNNAKEIEALSQEFLIRVTKFFRDGDAFEVLRQKTIPGLFLNKMPNSPIKIWIVGCCTGEEAYSVAILIKEHLNKIKKNFDVKIFASDIDKEALAIAGSGTYAENISQNVSTERLNNFFIKVGNKYRVTSQIRNMLIFAQHDIISDPPFSKIDLVVCRNVLIYMNADLQKKVLSTLHFVTNVGGFVFLGTSENVGDLKNALVEVSHKWKIYKNIQSSQSIWYSSPNYNKKQPIANLPIYKTNKTLNDTNLSEYLGECILEEYGSAGIYIDENYEIIKALGNFKKYLSLPEKMSSFSLLKMLPTGISIVLSTAIQKARKSNEKLIIRNIRIKENKSARFITIFIKPVISTDLNQKLCLVIFSEEQTPMGLTKNLEIFKEEVHFNERIIDLERELKITKNNLQAAIEDLETSNQELQSTNEELLSANEELQSTNEELQSLNEELHTINGEHGLKIDALIELNDDLNNYFRASDISQIFVDNNLIIRKFTPAALKQINLIDSDIGRPIDHISVNINCSDLTDDIKQVIKKSGQIDKQVLGKNNKWYHMNIIPYIKKGNKMDGVIISFFDVSLLKESETKLQLVVNDLKKAEEELKKLNDELELKVLERTRELSSSQERFHLLIKATNDAVWDWNIVTNKIWWNKNFKLGPDTQKDKISESMFSSIINKIHPEDKDRIHKSLNNFVENGHDKVWAEECRFLKADNTYTYLLIRGYAMGDKSKKAKRMIGSMIDLSELKNAKEEINLSHQKLNQQKEIVKVIISTQEEERKRIAEALHNGLSQLLYAVKLNMEYFIPRNDIKTKEGKQIQKKINDIIEEAIVETKTIAFELMPTILADFGLKVVIKDWCKKNSDTDFSMKSRTLGFEKRLEHNVEIAIFRIIQELVNNVIKHAKASECAIYLRRTKETIDLEVSDNGKGFKIENISKESMGLRNIKHRMELLNGAMKIKSAKGGTIISINFQL